MLRFARLTAAAKIAADLPCAGEVPCAPHLVRDMSISTFASTRPPRPASLAPIRPHLAMGRRDERHVVADGCNPRIQFSKEQAPVPRAAAACDALLRPCSEPGGSRHPAHVGGSLTRAVGVFVPPARAENRTDGVPSPKKRISSREAPRPPLDQARFAGPRVTGASNADEPGHLPSTSSREGIGRFDGLATISCVTRCPSRQALARR